MKQYLAIDYGTKRIGVAVNRAWLAEPLFVFDRKHAVKEITKLIRSERITDIILGIADGKMANESRKFIKELFEIIEKLPVKEVDETLTSRETHEKLAKSGMPLYKRRQPIDHFTAAAILQNYLDDLGSAENE